jgi:hypothetical protein
MVDCGIRMLSASPGERILEIGCGTGKSLLSRHAGIIRAFRGEFLQRSLFGLPVEIVASGVEKNSRE